MTISTALFTLLIQPLALLFEVIFAFAYRLLDNPGLCIVFLSLAVNLLILPLYRRADALQAEGREKEAAMAPMVRHIRAAFRGDERYLMLQAYYRECHYRQTDALRGSVSLLLQVPFFIAAYHFLSGLQLLNGTPFGPIADLSRPDALLRVGSLTLNALPLLMTAINLASAAVYMKGFPLKSKLQVVGMALVFLVLLYGSPAGMVFYWTLNNVFSLVKNLFARARHPRRAVGIACSICGLALLPAAFALLAMNSLRRRAFVIGCALLLQAPLALSAIRARRTGRARLRLPGGEDGRLFAAACVFLALLTGALIPSAIVGASPAEFVEVLFYQSPLVYVGIALLTAAGAFLVWPSIFYRLAGKAGRGLLTWALYLGAGAALLDYMAFGTGYGNLSSTLMYDSEPAVGLAAIAVNLLAIAALSAALMRIRLRRPALARGVLAVGCLAMAAMSAVNVQGILRETAVLEREVIAAAQDTPKTRLSRTGKNVVVIMMDRAPATYIPFLLAEKPELQEQFAGFTYYPRTLSYGMNTITGSPALYGGYEYRPEEINARKDERLVDKHDEALRVMPVIFDEAGFDVTVCDPSLAGYSWIPNLGIYADHPDIHTYITTGKFSGDVEGGWRRADAARRRNLFCYSLFRAAPAVLQNLPLMTEITDEPENTFLMLANDTVHNPILLHEPTYKPTSIIDNTEYDEAHAVRYAIDGRSMRITEMNQMTHYHVCMSMMMELGQWLSDLRARGVYDNTRIILVADHGLSLRQFDSLLVPGTEWEDITWFNPLLMVKDFDSQAFAIDGRFMTNADVPTIAFAGLVEQPVNPATGRAVTDEAKRDAEHHVIYYANNWNIDDNTGNVFTPASWYAVHGDILDPDNWRTLDSE